jgi:enoyl-CoA hydratase
MRPKVLFETRGRVAIFTLNRPDRRNAVDPDVTAQMNELVSRFEGDSDLWVGIVTGAGDEAFCAGADLKEIAEGRLSEIVDVEPYGFAGVVRGARRKPLIAAVNGYALAGGCEIALACDIVLASEHARFGLPEVRHGIIAGAGGLQRLPRIVPPLRALELILTGRTIDAREALSLGLVNEITALADLRPRAVEVAQAIAANAPIAVRESLAVARLAISDGEDAAWRRAAEAWQLVLASQDASEGPRAFAERRKPVWQGR